MIGVRTPSDRDQRKIRDMLRLSAAGMSKRKIAASLGVSADRRGVQPAGTRAVGRPLPEGLTDETLERRLFPPPTVVAKDRRPQPNWAAVHREIRWPGVTTVRRLRLPPLPQLTAPERRGCRRPCGKATLPASACSSITPARRSR